MKRHVIAGAVIGTFGAVLLAAGAAELWVSTIASDVLDLVRPEMTDEGLAQHRSDLERARDTIDGITTEVLPAIAEESGVPEALLFAGLALEYPAVALVLAEQDEAVPFAERALTNLELQQGRFERADSMPAESLPVWANGAWTVLLGAVLAAVAVVLVRGPMRQRKWAFLAAAGVAVLLVVLPLALQVPGKADDAEDVLDSLNPSDAVVQQTEGYYAHTRDGLEEFDTRLVPDIAATLGVTEEELDARLAREFPEVAAGLDAMPGVMERYETRVAIRSGGADELRTLKDIPLGLLGWFGPAVGAALGLSVAALAFVTLRRAPSPADTSVPEPVPAEPIAETE
jgi:hypothetical protein